MSAFISFLRREQIARLPVRTRDVVEYRKSGLSWSYAQNCPLGHVYCIRHIYGLGDHCQPRALMSDAEAYFQPRLTSVQFFNRANDPYLLNLRPRTFAVLEDLDARNLCNHILIIAWYQMKSDTEERSEALSDIKVMLLFSDIDKKQVEPCSPQIQASSLKLVSAPTARRYRTILDRRPLAPYRSASH